MDADVLTTRVVDGIAVITHGTDKRIHIDQGTTLSSPELSSAPGMLTLGSSSS